MFKHSEECDNLKVSTPIYYYYILVYTTPGGLFISPDLCRQEKVYSWQYPLGPDTATDPFERPNKINKLLNGLVVNSFIRGYIKNLTLTFFHTNCTQFAAK